MDVEESVVLEKLMGGKCQVIFDSGDSRNDLSSWSEMCDVSQGFKVDVFTVKRVFVVVVATENMCLLAF